MIYLFTDFGSTDIYVGQMKSRMLSITAAAQIVDLFHDNRAFDIPSAAHLLAALVGILPPDGIVVAVIDPGVGSSRRPIALSVGGRWIIGPDNGLLSLVAQRSSETAQYYEIAWRPQHLSATFHGRDLFGPFAAMLHGNQVTPEMLIAIPDALQLPNEDLYQCIHVDHYGNLITGIQAASLASSDVLLVKGRPIRHAKTYSAVAIGHPFWYTNSMGLVEIAVNQGSAAQYFGTLDDTAIVLALSSS